MKRGEMPALMPSCSCLISEDQYDQSSNQYLNGDAIAHAYRRIDRCHAPKKQVADTFSFSPPSHSPGTSVQEFLDCTREHSFFTGSTASVQHKCWYCSAGTVIKMMPLQQFEGRIHLRSGGAPSHLFETSSLTPCSTH
jgi:hypothetical protein